MPTFRTRRQSTADGEQSGRKGSKSLISCSHQQTTLCPYCRSPCTAKYGGSRGGVDRLWRNLTMAPTGPRSTAATVEPTPVVEQHPPVKGPHPGYISVANQYTYEQKLRRMQKENGCDPSREDSYRLQGIQLIENVRESLQLSVYCYTPRK